LSSEDKAEVQPRRLLSRTRGIFAAPGRFPALVVLAALAIVRALDPATVQSLRLRGFDFLEQIAPRKYQPLPVAIVTIDDKSLAQYGQWPWSRARVAQLVDKIASGKPSVLGVDIIFAEPDRLSPGRLVESDPEIPANVAGELARLPSHESALASALREVPTVLAVAASNQPSTVRTPSRVTMILESGGNPSPFLLTHPELVKSLPEIAAAERGEGSIDSEKDFDGITRRVPLFIVAEDHLVPDLPLEMLRVGSGARALGIVTGDEGAGGQVEDQTAIHLRVEGEVELVEGLVRVAKLGLFASAIQQSLAPPGQLVADQTRDQIDWGHGFGLSLAQSCFEYSGYPAEPKLSKCTL